MMNEENFLKLFAKLNFHSQAQKQFYSNMRAHSFEFIIKSILTSPSHPHIHKPPKNILFFFFPNWKNLRKTRIRTKMFFLLSNNTLLSFLNHLFVWFWDITHYTWELKWRENKVIFGGERKTCVRKQKR